MPTEVVKQRQQTSAYGAAATSLDALKLVVKQGGIKALYQGFLITISREVRPRHVSRPPQEEEKTLTIMDLLISGSVRLDPIPIIRTTKTQSRYLNSRSSPSSSRRDMR